MVKALIKKDLRSHFISPHFYICSLILYLACTFQYFIFNRFFVIGFGSSSLNGFFSVIPYVFSLIVPLLILQNSNHEVEETFPYASWKIISSKLVSTLIVLAAMVLPLAIVPVIVNCFGAVDGGQVAVGFTGIMLYGLLAISLCLFLNEIINSKPAFIAVSIIILLAIDSLHTVSLYIKSSDFFTNLFNSLSFLWHFDSFGKGIVDTRDLFFFILTSVLFILLSVYANEKGKGKKFFSGKLKIYSILTVFILIFAFADSNRIYTKFDFTKDKQFTVSRYTKDKIRNATEPIRITYYRSKELVNRYPEVRDIYDFLKICAKENINISLRLEDADTEENTKLLEKLNIAAQQIQTVNNNKTEYVKVYSAVVLDYLGTQKVIPFILSTANLEFELNLRLDSLLFNKDHSVYLLCGNEYEATEYSYLQMLFEASDINCYVITKESLEFLKDQLDVKIPLIIFGTNRLTPEDAASIEQFILNGGKTLMFTSQYSVNVNGDWGITKNIDDNIISLLEMWGVILEDKIVNDYANIRVSFYSPADNSDLENDKTQYEYINYPQWLSVLPQNNVPSGITMFWASPVKGTAKITPLFYSTQMSWTVSEFDKNAVHNSDQLFITNPFTVEKNPISDPLFKKEQVILGAMINSPITGVYNFETNENPHVIVIPDQYFAMNLLLELSGGESSDFRNLDFVMNLVLSLNDESELVSLLKTGQENKSLYKVTDAETYVQLLRGSLVVLFIIMPLLITAGCVSIYIVRARKNEKYKIF